MYPIIGLVAPSGGGKSALIAEMLRRYPSRVGAVKSITTRESRGPEDKLTYDEFISKDEMRRREGEGRLVQVSEYAGELYAHVREHLDRLLSFKVGIGPIVEQGVRNLRSAGYDVRVVKIVPIKRVDDRDEARRAADEERAKTALTPDLVLENSWEPGGFERAADELGGYIQSLVDRPA